MLPADPDLLPWLVALGGFRVAIWSSEEIALLLRIGEVRWLIPAGLRTRLSEDPDMLLRPLGMGIVMFSVWPFSEDVGLLL